MKNTENTSKTPAKPSVRKKNPVNKKSSPEPVPAEEQTVAGLESPIWLRNAEGRVFFGLKVDQAIYDKNDIRVSGWLVGALDKIELRINGENVKAAFSRVARPDVAQALGINEPAAGFGFQLVGKPPFANTPETKLSLYWSAGTESGEIVLHEENLNGPSRQSQQKTGSAEVRYHLDKIDGPCLYGWVVVGKRSAQNITVKANDRLIECEVIKKVRKDAAAELGVEAVDLGFQLIIPGYLWEEIPLDENPRIQFLADGLPLANIAFTRKNIVEWIEKLVDLAHDSKKVELLDYSKEVELLLGNSEKQYLVLLALEHIRYGDLSKLLTPNTLRFMQKFAIKMNLADFLPAGDAKPEVLQADDSFTQLLLNKSLWILNERLSLADSPNALFATVVDVMHELDLEGEVKERYLGSVIPTLCRHDILLRIRELTDLSHWHNCDEASDSCWGVTTALPALVVDQKIARATNALWKLTKHLNLGWINIECIHFSVKELNRQFLAGLIEADQTEKFVYAVLGILDAFRGEWFSRLHDRDLVQSAVALLDVFDSYSDHCRRDLIKALIRNYGLVPEFWQTLINVHPDFHDAELDRARVHWQRLCEVLESPALHEQLDQLLQPLSYFLTIGNPETIIFLREILMNSLPQLNNNLSPAGQLLLEMLFKDVPEGLRLAAFPMAGSNSLQASFPESSSRLLKTLRELTPRAKSAYYQAQCEAGQLILQTLETSADNDHKALADKLKVLRRYATTLNNWPSQFLSVDLQVLAYELGRQAGLAKDSELHLIAGRIRKIVAETKQDWFLPASIQAALARLNRYEDDLMVRAFLADMRQLIQQKFADTYDFLFKSSKTQAFSANGTGFPSDTLVVIYSCRKYLDTRIAAIRNTWVQDLIARNIPYLVLVGDGDDSIDGDILALNVSDKYEDLPKKTLKLFDWVVENTAFQYVYKIDDDCYLDVSRFFDTLTYRKHFYYGRVIQRFVGSMDRAWHQAKSHALHAQKVLDKSPEPSIYADGGGGYVLSRLAMLKLQETSQTEAGQRLIAVSLMEDKLVGDLLSISGIGPSNEDYESYQRRRTFAEALPVGMWDNIFFPGPNTPTVMTHLDTDRDMQNLHEQRSVDELWPKKVWPTCFSLLIKEKGTPDGIITATNQLELMSTPEQLSGLLKNSLAVVVVVRNEMIMLPHFLDHYRRLGVRCFLMVDNLSDDGTREYLLEQPDVGLFSTDTEYKNSHYGVAWQQALLGNFCLNKWVLLADADELLVYPDCETVPLAEFIEGIEQEEGADCIRTDMIDMYPFADLDDADLTVESPFAVAKWFDASPFTEWRLGKGQFSNSSSLLSSLRHRITPSIEPNTFTAQKYGLLRYKPWMRLSQGIHDAAGVKVAAQSVWFAHFKYHAGFKDKVETEIRRGQHFGNAKEYLRYAEILAESKGGFGDEELSVCYESSANLSHWRTSKNS